MYVATGEVIAADAIRDWFLRHRKDAPRVFSHHIADQEHDIKPSSPIMLGSPRTNPWIVQELAPRTLRFRNDTVGTITLNDFPQKLRGPLRRFAIEEEGPNVILPSHDRTSSHAFAIVYRFPLSDSRAVTIISSDHTGAGRQVAEDLVAEGRTKHFLEAAGGMPTTSFEWLFAVPIGSRGPFSVEYTELVAAWPPRNET